MKTIQYAFDDETGLTWSRVGDEVAIPILDYPKTETHLEKESVFSVCTLSTWEQLRWTKNLPKSLKNYHRSFWGMKELK